MSYIYNHNNRIELDNRSYCLLVVSVFCWVASLVVSAGNFGYGVPGLGASGRSLWQEPRAGASGRSLGFRALGRSLWQELGGQRERFVRLEQEFTKRLQVEDEVKLEVVEMALQEGQKPELERELR